MYTIELTKEEIDFVYQLLQNVQILGKDAHSVACLQDKLVLIDGISKSTKQTTVKK